MQCQSVLFIACHAQGFMGRLDASQFWGLGHARRREHAHACHDDTKQEGKLHEQGTQHSLEILQVHKGFFGQQLFLRFPVVRIVDATIHRTHGRTLGLIMKAHAFGALV